MTGSDTRTGLIIRRAPGLGRSLRDDLDMALAVAVQGRELALFFTGGGLLQLLDGRDVAAARWPAGLKAWAGLPGMAPVSYQARSAELDELDACGAAWLVRPEPLGEQAWRDAQRACHRLLVV